MALIWLPNESDPAAQIKVVRAAALMNFLPLVIKAACLRGMINGPQRSCRPSASIPTNAVARKLTKPSTGLGPGPVQGHRCALRGRDGTGNRHRRGRLGPGPGRRPRHCHTQRVKGLAERPPPVRQPSAMGRAQGGGNGGLEGTAEGDLWQVGCPGGGGVGCFNAAFPYSTAMQAWGTRPVPSPRHWSPELSLVVWLWVQPEEKRQRWGLALPRAGRSMWGQG